MAESKEYAIVVHMKDGELTVEPTLANAPNEIWTKLFIFLDYIKSPCVTYQTKESNEYKTITKWYLKRSFNVVNDINNDVYRLGNNIVYNNTKDYFIRMNNEVASNNKNYNAHKDIKKFMSIYKPKNYSLKTISPEKKLTIKRIGDHGNIIVITDVTTTTEILFDYDD